MSVIMEKLSNIIPDFREIVDIFNGMMAQHTEDTAHIEDQTKTWARCSPSLYYLTECLQVPPGLAGCSLQVPEANQDPGAGGLFSEAGRVCVSWNLLGVPEVLAADHHHGSLYQESLLALCQENKRAMAAELAIHTEDVIMTWVSEQQILVSIYRPWGLRYCAVPGD